MQCLPEVIGVCQIGQKVLSNSSIVQNPPIISSRIQEFIETRQTTLVAIIVKGLLCSTCQFQILFTDCHAAQIFYIMHTTVARSNYFGGVAAVAHHTRYTVYPHSSTCSVLQVQLWLRSYCLCLLALPETKTSSEKSFAFQVGGVGRLTLLHNKPQCFGSWRSYASVVTL